MFELLAIILYFILVFIVGISSYKRSQNSSDFIIGNRSMNYWLTALAAHASDMSSWLFMAYPAMIFAFGLNKVWIAIGLILCMYCNWQFIASKIRIATEKTKSLTFFSYLEHRFSDRSGSLRIFSALVCFIFYTIYISAGLVGLGLLVESLFHISFKWAVFASIFIALPYVLIGGYRTLAWLDLFQGLFLMMIIVFVPCYLISGVGGWEGIRGAADLHKISLQVLPEFSFTGWMSVIVVALGWGLGYFGQPAIITKFMGINDPKKITKSKYVGMSWMLISLLAATVIGLIGIPFFKGSLENPEMLFINMVKSTFHPFFIGLILCAIFAASINVMCSQILVVCSSLSEDIYKKLIRQGASSKELLLISRLGALFISILAFLIAFFKVSTIYSLVLYAWSGLGAAFGPLLIFSLYSKKMDKVGAWVGIITGSLSAALWPLVGGGLSFQMDPIIVGFTLSSIAIVTTGLIRKPVDQEVAHFSE